MELGRKKNVDKNEILEFWQNRKPVLSKN